MQGYGFVTLLTQLQSRIPSHTCTCTPAIFHKNTISFSLDQVLVAVPPELSCYIILTLTFLMVYIQKLFIYKCIRVSCDTFTYNGRGTYQTIRRRGRRIVPLLHHSTYKLWFGEACQSHCKLCFYKLPNIVPVHVHVHVRTHACTCPLVTFIIICSIVHVHVHVCTLYDLHREKRRVLKFLKKCCQNQDYFTQRSPHKW